MNFDYVIVGAGSAGCVLADRLSANGRSTVLVLEAGGSDYRFFVQMPLGYGKTFYDPAVNWMYKTEPDPGLNGQASHWPRGKVLGGSSSINAMVYIRGAREDFEEWEEQGNKGWGWADVLKAFRAMEDNSAGANEYRGVGGPLYVNDNSLATHPLYDPFVKASVAAGIPFNPDFNGETQEGVGNYQITTKNGRRNSAARAFLRPAMKRKNVKVETGAHATRILFEGKKAIGVEYMVNGQTRTAFGAREIIVSGGAINSPQLLQLSGIGPATLLKQHGISVVQNNLNVGAHLQDHLGLNYTYRSKIPTLNDELRPWWGKLKVGVQYLLTRTGPLSQSVNQGGGFFRSSPRHKRANLQLYMQAITTVVHKPMERPLLTPDSFSGFSLGLSSCRPTSRGSIEIRSSNPFEQPKITANAYSTAADVREMLEGTKIIRRIAAQEPLASLIAEEMMPGPSCLSDKDVINDFRQRSSTIYHPVSTCRMGPSPGTSVVDSTLRVHGVQNLRVCDASIFPNLISGNTNAASMMVGWKGAEIILGAR